MDPVSILDNTLLALGYGAYVPAVLAVVGAFSAVATIYPSNWKGASLVHKFALLLGKAKPAVPAGAAPVPSLTTAQNYTSK